MTLQSIVIGTLFGIMWGILFSDRYKRLSSASSAFSKTSSWFLASTSVMRYLLLAALLITLLTKQYINLTWWLISFMISFWLVLTQSVKPSIICHQEHKALEKKERENPNI